MRAFANLFGLASLLLALPTALAQTTWTGGASTGAWCDAANWTAGVPTAATDAFVRGGASVYPEIDGTEGCTVEARVLYINDDESGGRVSVMGGAIDVASLLYTENTGGDTGLRLEGGQITVSAMDLYGDHSSRFTGGELTLDGSNATTRFYGSFQPSGTLVRTVSAGPQAPNVFFANPGTGAGQSFFEHLIVEGVGLDINGGGGGANGTAWITESLTLASGTLLGGNVHYTTTLPVIGGGTYTVTNTHFHGTRTLGSGESFLLPFGSLFLNDGGTTDGRITVDGGTLDVPNTLYTHADNKGGITLMDGQITVSAMDLYGDHSSRFTGGELTLDGSNATTRFYGSFQPSGTLVRTVSAGPQAPNVFFANPGTGAGQSFFEHLIVEGVGLDINGGGGGANGTAWITESLTLASGTLLGGNVHYTTTLPVIGGGTYTVTNTHFHGTRTLGSGESFLLPFGSLYLNENGTAGGRIIVNGGVLDIPGSLFTYADNNGGIALLAGQVAASRMDLYGDHSARFSGGELTFDGSNATTRVYGTFRPTGTLVRFIGAGGPQAPNVFFANPGTGAGQSYFEHLVVEGTGLDINGGGGGANGTAWVTESITLVSGTVTGNIIAGKPRLISPASVGQDPLLRLTSPFTVSGLNVNGLEVEGIGQLIFEGGGCIRLDNAAFTTLSTTVPRLTIRHPGGKLELNNLSFDPDPGNVHLAAEDTAPGNPYRLDLHIVNPAPSTATAGTNYTEVGGAEVLWDGAPLEPLPVTLTLEAADAPPVVVPDSGGALTYRATLANTSPEPQTFEARIVAILPNGSTFGPIQGPRVVRVPANQTIGPVSFTDNVPAIAPVGTYGVVLEGTTLCPEATPAPGGFTFEKEPADTTQARMPSLSMLRAAWAGEQQAAWTASSVAPSEAAQGDEESTAASGAARPEAFLLRTAYPNPFRRATTLELDVPAVSTVQVAVYDPLGRRVAVLHDGSLAAGTHRLTLEAALLPSGVYLIRATDGSTSHTQRITMLR